MRRICVMAVAALAVFSAACVRYMPIPSLHSIASKRYVTIYHSGRYDRPFGGGAYR